MAILFGIFFYLVLQILLGIWLSRSIATEADYIIAGRKLGYALTTFGIFGTWFASESVVSASGAVFREGIPAITADYLSWSVGLIVLGIVFAARLRRMELTTLGDLFRNRYGGLVEKITVLMLVPASLFWAAGQIRAFGVVLSGFSDLSMPLAVTIAAVSVIVYTTFGGMLADAYTDLIQSLVIIFGLLFLIGYMIAHGGLTALGEIPAAHFHLSASPLPVWEHLEIWLQGIFGTIITAELVARILAARSPKVATWSTITAGILYILLLGLPILMGLVGIHLFTELEDPEQLIILQAQHYLPKLLFVVFLGALISAILSTVDSTLLAIGSLIAHNLILPMRKQTDEKKKLILNRLMVVSLGLLAYLMALQGGSVHEIAYTGAYFGVPGLTVIYLFAFKGRFGRQGAALTALFLGTAIPWLGDNYLDFIPYPFLTGFLIAVAGFLFVGYRERSGEKKEKGGSQQLY